MTRAALAIALIAASYVSICNYNVASCHHIAACIDAGR